MAALRDSITVLCASLTFLFASLGQAADITNTNAATSGKDDEAELAKKLQNPVASLSGLPFQNNWDFGIGPKAAMKYTLNIQPVIPFSVSKTRRRSRMGLLCTVTLLSPSESEPLISTNQAFTLRANNNHETYS